MNCITYARISPRPSDSDSLDVQREELAAYAAAQGWHVIAHFEDDKRSGSELMRPGIQSAVAALSRDSVLLVRDLSRFARDVAVALALEAEMRRIGAYLATYESGIVLDPTADALAYHDAILPRFVKYWSDARERLVKNARTSARMREHQQNGRRMSGNAPVGFRVAEDGKTLVPSESDVRAATRATELRKSGASLREIARSLEEEGYNGRRWSHKNVGKLLALDPASEERQELGG